MVTESLPPPRLPMLAVSASAAAAAHERHHMHQPHYQDAHQGHPGHPLALDNLERTALVAPMPLPLPLPMHIAGRREHREVCVRVSVCERLGVSKRVCE
ncbi:Lipoprotein-releasing system ATP-binding protein LolD [Frankliniella fusca]|uniref:Lipoprotein-releasing system ATP-binding protein LolD n=1 Tax=Frankliniella fusca TaxID=407009 RepID=A0AAE1HFX7_9NEOP|nr:Lipoprotein-releasing system ATP-binding protein LolD [Frankliniella fusca]